MAYDSRSKEAEKRSRFGRVLPLYCVELLLEVCGERRMSSTGPTWAVHPHFAASSTVFGRSRKLRTYLLILTPACSFALSTSTLFKNRTKSTLANSLFAQTSFHRSRLSSYPTNSTSTDRKESTCGRLPVYSPTGLRQAFGRRRRWGRER
jgi:hypothetical protein